MGNTACGLAAVGSCRNIARSRCDPVVARPSYEQLLRYLTALPPAPKTPRIIDFTGSTSHIAGYFIRSSKIAPISAIFNRIVRWEGQASLLTSPGDAPQSAPVPDNRSNEGSLVRLTR